MALVNPNFTEEMERFGEDTALECFPVDEPARFGPGLVRVRVLDQLKAHQAALPAHFADDRVLGLHLVEASHAKRS